MTDRDELSPVRTPAGTKEGKWEWLVCPRCSAGLRESCQALHCSDCQREWPIVDGTPHFVDQFPYWGEIPFEQMREVNHSAASGPWKSPLVDSQDPAVQRAAHMILNLERANWQYLIDLPAADSRVLDLGAGMGTNSHALGRHYRSVVAVEPVLERVQFMRQRFAQENLSNIEVVRSSVWDLPFRTGSFDLVAMNGVLEWVAGGRAGDPGQLQKEAIAKISSLIRPGGCFYLGIENRLALGYFAGYADPHCGLPWVTILPRRLAHWYARSKGQDGYRNYLYTSSGYRRLLRNAGFSRVEVYIAIPSYNHPRYLIPLKGSLFSYFSHNFNVSRRGGFRGLLHRAILATGLLKYFEYSFAIVAYK